MKILVTGLSGLVGSRFTELLGDSYEFEGITRESGVDITDEASINRKILSSDAQIILHLAAKADVDGCEKDKEIDEKFLAQKDFDRQDWINKKTAWTINVSGTKYIVEACKEANKKIIFVSTDFVFNGDKSQDEGYVEEDIQNPINWYGKTKYEAEKLVLGSGLDWTIVRLAYPYRANFAKKNDFLRAIMQRFKNGQSLNMIADHIMTPTFIDDFVYAIDSLIKTNSSGIFNVVGDQFISPYECAVLVAEKFNFDKGLITQITRKEYFKDKAQRPFFLGLKNDKIKNMGIKMRSFENGLEEVKKQIL